MIDALIKRVSVTCKYYEMYAHRGKYQLRTNILLGDDAIVFVPTK